MLAAACSPVLVAACNPVLKVACNPVLVAAYNPVLVAACNPVLVARGTTGPTGHDDADRRTLPCFADDMHLALPPGALERTSVQGP